MSNTTVENKNISIRELRHTIAEVVQDILEDPDFGMKFNSKTVKDLRESLKQKQEGKITTLEEILKRRMKRK